MPGRERTHHHCETSPAGRRRGSAEQGGFRGSKKIFLGVLNFNKISEMPKKLRAKNRLHRKKRPKIASPTPRFGLEVGYL